MEGGGVGERKIHRQVAWGGGQEGPTFLRSKDGVARPPLPLLWDRVKICIENKEIIVKLKLKVYPTPSV